MPVISCGGMRYQHKWSDVAPEDVPKANQANLEATIHRALELGINHIETARGYGSSEMQLGWVLPQLPRDQIIVQTKVRPYATQKEFFEVFEQSMDYLKLDHVDLLSLHGINDRQFLDWSLKKGGSVEAARKLQEDGRCKHIGFSTHATPEIILEAVESDAFDYVNLHWYFVNDLNGASIKAANKRDMGVFIISPNDKGGRLYDPPKKLVDLCAPLTPMQFNSLYCLARNEVHTLSCGAAKPADFDEHLAALEHYDQIKETIAPMEKNLRDELDRVLGSDWTKRWTEGLPEYADVPGRINIVEILRLWMYSKALDIVGWGKMRYNLLSGEGGDWFPGEKARQFNDAKIIQAVSQSPFANRIPDILREAHAMLDDKPAKRLSQSD